MPDGQPTRKHRRIAYRAQMSRPFKHAEDSDLIDGVYRDLDGRVIGPIIFAEPPHARPDVFLLVPDEALPLVHVEAALDADHRITAYEQVFGLLYEAGEQPAPAVAATGDRWDAGDLVVYTFESDEDALAAQEYPAGI
jgi:hypothetical protein